MYVNITQGEDLLLDIIVVDANNNKVDVSAADSIRVAFSVDNYCIPKRYKDDLLEPAVLPNYGSLYPIDSNTIQIVLEREDTIEFPVGEELRASVLIQFPDTGLIGQAFEYTYIVGKVNRGYLTDAILP